MTVRTPGLGRAGHAGRGRQATREAVVATALRLFAERGYLGVRVEDIAREAGVSRATFYKYFSEREEILAALFDRLLGDEPDIEPDPLAGTEGQVKATAEAAIRQMLEQEELARFVYSLPVRHTALLRPQDVATPAVFRQIHRLIEQGVERGDVREDLPVELMCSHVHGALETAMRDWAEGKVDDPIARLTQLLELAFHGVAAADAPAKPNPRRHAARRKA